MESKRLSAERRKNLKALIKRMNSRQRDPFPMHKTLIDCFDAGITPEENAYLLKLGDHPYTYEELAAFSDHPEEFFRPFFDSMRRKGLLWPELSEDGKERYALAGIMVGWFEAFLSDGKKTLEQQEFARSLEKYFRYLKKMNFFPIRNLQNRMARKHAKAPRTIAVAKRTDEDTNAVRIDINMQLDKPEMMVSPTASVYDLVNKYGDENKIAVMHCFCREWKKMVDEPCRLGVPGESCMVIGDFADHIVDIRIGRPITKEDALELIQDLQKKGTIHQVFYDKDDLDRPEIAICNCCWDCCGVFGSYNRGITPLRLKSFYTARISDGASCSGCGTCLTYCPVGAISLENNKSRIHSEKCIGCGQCELQCPEDVFTLEYIERDVILPLRKRSEARIP